MDLEDNDNGLPVGLPTFGIPNDPLLRAVYDLYRPPEGSFRQMQSERNRDTFSEAFIEHERVGTLADLCVRALAKRGTMHIVDPVRLNPLWMRIHYDSIDVNLPLRECYFVEDARFWKRVVLAKSSEQCLSLKGLDDYDWRGKGMSIKYVELVEACPASLWPEKEMSELAELIRDYVRCMDIRHLQSLSEFSFRRLERHSSDTEPEVSSEVSDGIEVSSDEPSTPKSRSDEGEEEQEQETEPLKKTFVRDNTLIAFKVSAEFADSDESTSDMERREARRDRNAARQKLRELKMAQEAEHEQRKQRRVNLLKREPEPPPKRRRRPKPVRGVFDIAVEPEPDDGEDQILDHRNKTKYLQYLKQFDYDEDTCHHIDLSFVGHFVNLVSLNLEFLGPGEGTSYHKRHLRFSLKDMVHLSKGLAKLVNLQIFRLRNSHLNAFKLYPLCRVLRALPQLHVVDLGYDQMTDDCGPYLGILLDRQVMLKALELEYNQLDMKSVAAIGVALQKTTDSNLQYLGLAHNRLSSGALEHLCERITGTEHVEELNLSAIGLSFPRVFVEEVCRLLRNHKPLRRLEMVATPLGADLRRELICALETNPNIIYFDCRACNFEEDEEFEADMIVRRNLAMTENTYVRDTAQFPDTLELLEHAKSLRHPLVTRIEESVAQQKECFKNYPTWKSSRVSVEDVPVIEKEESDYDIWTVFALQTQQNSFLVQNSTEKAAAVQEPASQKISQSSSPRSSVFSFDPNNFTLEQFREHVYQPGPGNRYNYFVEKRDSKF